MVSEIALGEIGSTILLHPSSIVQEEQILEQNLKKTTEPRQFVTGRRTGLSHEIRLYIRHVLLGTGKGCRVALATYL